MTLTGFLKMYGMAAVICLGLDFFWLRVVATSFYQREIGHLMRAEAQLVPALAFYMIYVAALVVFVIAPAVGRQSVARAIGYGAFFGVAAYATFDLTCLALFRDFPVEVAMVDLAWGATLSATVCGITAAVSRRWESLLSRVSQRS